MFSKRGIFTKRDIVTGKDIITKGGIATKGDIVTKGDMGILIGILIAAFIMIGIQVMPIFASRAYVLEITGPEGSDRIQVEDIPAGGWRRDIGGKVGSLRLAYEPEKGFHVESASCPDLVCVHSGYIHRAGQSIVCVPNGIIIRLINGGGEEGDTLDGITR